MKANKGEWAELYSFFKILDEKKLFAADKNLEIIPDKFFVFKKIFRNETNKTEKIYDISGSDIVILDNQGNVLKTIKDEDLPEKIKAVFSKIKETKSTTFEILEAEKLMDEFLCNQIKASSSHKADIEAEIYDRITETIKPLGFSVKSMIGGASTLLNAGKTTNFIFEVNNINEKDINEINAISTKSKVQDRVKAIYDKSGSLNFKKVAKKEFEANLRKIDTVFPLFISQMLIDFFLVKCNKVSELTELLAKNIPLQEQYGLSYSDYEFKVKNFLQSTALGMIPSKIWDGFTKAYGGYIIVRNDGVVICYHLYNRDEFLSYLYENTKFESASTSRHDYGKIYLEDGRLLFNLNLQVRFVR